jgi:isopentenyldiphosphate isomerase
MNSAGRIYLQKRSRIKEENTGMYDKTVGGHIVAGDSANMTVVKECAEEM